MHNQRKCQRSLPLIPSPSEVSCLGVNPTASAGYLLKVYFYRRVIFSSSLGAINSRRMSFVRPQLICYDNKPVSYPFTTSTPTNLSKVCWISRKGANVTSELDMAHNVMQRAYRVTYSGGKNSVHTHGYPPALLSDGLPTLEPPGALPAPCRSDGLAQLGSAPGHQG